MPLTLTPKLGHPTPVPSDIFAGVLTKADRLRAIQDDTATTCRVVRWATIFTAPLVVAGYVILGVRINDYRKASPPAPVLPVVEARPELKYPAPATIPFQPIPIQRATPPPIAAPALPPGPKIDPPPRVPVAPKIDPPPDAEEVRPKPKPAPVPELFTPKVPEPAKSPEQTPAPVPQPALAKAPEPVEVEVPEVTPMPTPIERPAAEPRPAAYVTPAPAYAPPAVYGPPVYFPPAYGPVCPPVCYPAFGPCGPPCPTYVRPCW